MCGICGHVVPHMLSWCHGTIYAEVFLKCKFPVYLLYSRICDLMELGTYVKRGRKKEKKK